jgi:hypothetical protein
VAFLEVGPLRDPYQQALNQRRLGSTSHNDVGEIAMQQKNMFIRYWPWKGEARGQ